mmetsp:Transcript_59168/g.170992  ORF Transcript_59168/g.170992 Transcript_59168/m.170992 type:complete len:150 (+) Transcript_59168:140-589(+)
MWRTMSRTTPHTFPTNLTAAQRPSPTSQRLRRGRARAANSDKNSRDPGVKAADNDVRGRDAENVVNGRDVESDGMDDIADIADTADELDGGTATFVDEPNSDRDTPGPGRHRGPRLRGLGRHREFRQRLRGPRRHRGLRLRGPVRHGAL